MKNHKEYINYYMMEGGNNMKVHKPLFGETFDSLLDENIIKYGRIHIFIWNDEKLEYESFKDIGLGSFTGIGYDVLLSKAYIDHFEMKWTDDGQIITFHLSSHDLEGEPNYNA